MTSPSVIWYPRRSRRPPQSWSITSGRTLTKACSSSASSALAGAALLGFGLGARDGEGSSSCCEDGTVEEGGRGLLRAVWCLVFRIMMSPSTNLLLTFSAPGEAVALDT